MTILNNQFRLCAQFPARALFFAALLSSSVSCGQRPATVDSPHGSVPFGAKAYSPDGKLLAQEIEPKNTGTIGLYAVGSSDAPLRVIEVRTHLAGRFPNDLKGLAWSPDSASIAVMYHHDGGGHISVVRVDTGTESKCFRIDGWPHSMAFSKDGKTIQASSLMIDLERDSDC
jgi:hypothetical protein